MESNGFYSVNRNSIMDDLHVTWHLDLDFEGRYASDYLLLQNDLIEERTSWRDKYTTVVYSLDYLTSPVKGTSYNQCQISSGG